MSFSQPGCLNHGSVGDSLSLSPDGKEILRYPGEAGWLIHVVRSSKRVKMRSDLSFKICQ